MDRYALCKGPLIFGAAKRETEYESNLELRQGYNGTNTKCTFVTMCVCVCVGVRSGTLQMERLFLLPIGTLYNSYVLTGSSVP